MGKKRRVQRQAGARPPLDLDAVRADTAVAPLAPGLAPAAFEPQVFPPLDDMGPASPALIAGDHSQLRSLLPLDAVALAHQALNEAEELFTATVREALRRGESAAEVARVLGVSRQAVWKRFG